MEEENVLTVPSLNKEEGLCEHTHRVVISFVEGSLVPRPFVGEWPGYKGPGCKGPGYEGAGYEGAGYEGPGYEAPGYEGPGYEGPGYNAMWREVTS